MGEIYVGNDFQRLMARAEVENFFFFRSGWERGEEEGNAWQQKEEDKKKEKEQIKRMKS